VPASAYNQGSGTLAPEVRAQYDKEYLIASQANLAYDQLTDARDAPDAPNGVSREFPLIDSLQPQFGVLDEMTDVTPQVMRANAISVTLGEHGGAVQLTRFVIGVSYSDVLEQAAYANGYNMAESIDIFARDTMGQGGRQYFPVAGATRATLSGATATHKLAPGPLELVSMLARQRGMPLFPDNTLAAVCHPFVIYDLLQDTASIRALSIQQHAEIMFNAEIAYWGGIRLVSTRNAKILWGAGAANASAVATTLAANSLVGDSNIKVTAITNIAVGQTLTLVDVTEPGNTWTNTNEGFVVTAVGTAGAGGTGITGYAVDPGPGDAGGLRFAHTSGIAITNNYSVFPVSVVGPRSVVKAWSTLTGPYGESVVAPSVDTLGRFQAIGWYAILGYARTRTDWVNRIEVASSQA